MKSKPAVVAAAALAIFAVAWLVTVAMNTRREPGSNVQGALGFYGAMLVGYLAFSAAMESKAFARPEVTVMCGVGLWTLFMLTSTTDLIVIACPGPTAEQKHAIWATAVLPAILVLKYFLATALAPQPPGRILRNAE